MMKKLIECVDMRYEDGTFLLQPKQSCEMDLVMLGFNGTEKWMRLRCWQHKSPGIGNGAWEYEATICKAKSSGEMIAANGILSSRQNDAKGRTANITAYIRLRLIRANTA